MKHHRFAICIDNSEYPASLEKRKIYEVLGEEDASGNTMLRIIDESGDDYLYPSSLFVDAQLKQSVEDAVVKAA